MGVNMNRTSFLREIAADITTWN